ncbi:type III pantothenate kinase [Raoultibacter massiliensis]|uniref:type III pantothenate kinase n=1 Tax=Raoultibacter massiliensis TaxID=1852371 RepID=UPI000C8206C9|nr:type III pantothenate kinase [Raoultibacter massiliensis]
MAANANRDAAFVLAVDVGNTVTRFGLIARGVLAASWEFATRERMTSDEARLEIANFLNMLERERTRAQAKGDDARLFDSVFSDDGRFVGNPTDAILSSVVPDLTDIWVGALAVECGRKPFVVGPGLKTGLKMHYNDPSEVGSDRVATLVAAREAYGYPLIVVDLGTTTNFDVLDGEGAFAGGVIAPGIALSAKALAQAAARLPVIEIKVPSSTIGKSTREAMQAGVVLGEVARIDGLVDAIWAELGCSTKVVATGVQAGIVAALSQRVECADEPLVLRGLGMLYALNSKR